MNELILENGIGTNQYQVKPKVRKVKKPKIGKFMVIAILLVAVTGYVAYLINSHTFDWQTPVKFQTPLIIGVRKPQVITITETKADENVNPLTEDQQYLCNKFGKDCKVALAIAKAESGFNCNAMHVNTNGTVDFSLFQLNSVHMKKGWTLKDMGDCRKNIDLAFELYQKQGWTPWVTYTNNSYKKFLY